MAVPPSDIPKQAAAASDAVINQAGAPCCTIGLEAFANSEEALAAEYDDMAAELSGAQSALVQEFNTAESGWNQVEQFLQVNKAPAWTVNRVIAEWQQAETAWTTAETNVAAEISNAEAIMQSAEVFLAAEAAWFGTEACGVAAPAATTQAAPKKGS